MNICIPVERYEGKDTRVYGHFGSAPSFVIYDAQSRNFEIVDNGNMHHAHGQCSPIAALGGREVDILVTGGIGAGAIMKLRMMGIKVCRVDTGQTIEDVIKSFEQGTLTEIQGSDACSHHSCS